MWFLGLVNSEIRMDSANQARTFMDELIREREQHTNSMPYAWLLAKMQRIGLETSVHNFTLHYPMAGGKKFTGKNVYGILRAPRIGSTESFVISTPYRTPDSIHPEISHGIPLILAFAKFARCKYFPGILYSRFIFIQLMFLVQKYWAKDIIFLFTDHEQLGMQAWLEAYYGSGLEEANSKILDAGSLDIRAGAIQAALNLEIPDFDVNYINVKIEGLNGQLPNLDLVNLVQRIANKEGIPCGHKMASPYRRSGSKGDTKKNLEHLFSMVLSQASGVPNGNHGLFSGFGIQAVTLEGHKKKSSNAKNKLTSALSLIRTIEGISRSINNLLERFHQSFFFYLLVASDRYISIGDYMPSIAAMAGALLIKAFIIWLSLHQNKMNEDEKGNIVIRDIKLNYERVGILVIAVHCVGFALAYLPFFKPIDDFIVSRNISTEYGILCILAIGLLLPAFLLPLLRLKSNEIELLHIAVLLETGTALLVVSLINFSLAYILCAIIVPFGIMVNPHMKFKSYVYIITFVIMEFNVLI